MKKLLVIGITAVIALILIANMFFFQLRYDQVAIKTRFNQPGDDALVTKAGLHSKLPAPVHNVTTFSKKLKILEVPIEELQTRDDKSIIIRTYVIWRIEDPLAFFNSLESDETAEKQLRERLEGIRGIVSDYNFNQLVNPDPKLVKLDEIEQKLRERLQVGLEDTNYGIQVERVGIRKLVLPEAVTETVYTAMIKTRERMAENAKQEGQSTARRTRTSAQADAAKILAFADRRAGEIRSVGDAAAAAHLAVFNDEDAELALFLRRLDTIRRVFADNKTTFVIDADDLDITRYFRTDPGANLSNGSFGAPAPTGVETDGGAAGSAAGNTLGDPAGASATNGVQGADMGDE